jgi:hypothetical protein
VIVYPSLVLYRFSYCFTLQTRFQDFTNSISYDIGCLSKIKVYFLINETAV